MLNVECCNCGEIFTGDSYRKIKFCRRCRRCMKCRCACKGCPVCAGKHPFHPPWICSYCGTCRKGCSCRKRPGKLKGNFIENLRSVAMAPRKIMSPQYGEFVTGGKILNSLARPLALEVELSSWGTLAEGPRFKHFQYTTAHDGSVKPSETEMVLSPMSGDGYLRAMFELAEALVKSKAEVNKTCGLHVHVDATDLSYWDLRRFLVLYMGYEEEIYRLLVAPDRASNTRFCGMLDATSKAELNGIAETKDIGEVKNAIQRMVFGTNWEALKEIKTSSREAVIEQEGIVKEAIANKRAPATVERCTEKLLSLQEKANRADYNLRQKASFNSKAMRSKYGGDHGTRPRLMRYLGMNIYSWFHRGTLEWRMKEGTTSLQELVCWPLFCAWMVDISTRLTDAQVRKLPSLMTFLEYGIKVNGIGGDEKYVLKLPEFIHTWAQGRARLVEGGE
jgi:hypothetical protein